LQLSNTNDDSAQNFETSIIFDDKIPVVNIDPVFSTGKYNHFVNRNLYFYFIEQFYHLIPIFSEIKDNKQRVP